MAWKSRPPDQGSFCGISADFGSVNAESLAIALARFVRAACLQNETAPEKLLNRYEKWFEKREKGSEKRSETRPKQKNNEPLSGHLKIFHRHSSTNFKSFSPPKICTKKKIASPRGSAGVATLSHSDQSKLSGDTFSIEAPPIF